MDARMKKSGKLGIIVGLFFFCCTVCPSYGDWQALCEKGGRCHRRLEDSAAEALYKAALKEAEESKADDLALARILYGLADVYRTESKDDEAVGALERAKVFYEKSPKESLALASCLSCLASQRMRQKRFAEGEQLYKRRLDICRRLLLDDDSELVSAWRDCGGCACRLGKFAEAEEFYRHALEAVEKKPFPANGCELGWALNDLGNLYTKEKKFKIAEDYFKRALYIEEEIFYPSAGQVYVTMQDYLEMLRGAGRKADARTMEKRMNDIVESMHTHAGGIDRQGKDQGKYIRQYDSLMEAKETSKENVEGEEPVAPFSSEGQKKSSGGL